MPDRPPSSVPPQAGASRGRGKLPKPGALRASPPRLAHPRPQPPVCRRVDGWADPALGRHPRHGLIGRGHRPRRRVDQRPPGIRRSRSAVERRLGVVDAAERPGCRDASRSAGNVCHGGAASEPCSAGQDGRDPRRGERRAGHPRPRRGLERARVRGVRHPLRPPVRSLRGGASDHHRDAPDRPGGSRGRLQPGPRSAARAPRPAARRPAGDGRRGRAADAAPDRRARGRVERRHANARRAAAAPGRRRRGMCRDRTRSDEPACGRRRCWCAPCRRSTASGPRRWRSAVPRRSSPRRSAAYGELGISHVQVQLRPNTVGAVEALRPVVEALIRAEPSEHAGSYDPVRASDPRDDVA